MRTSSAALVILLTACAAGDATDGAEEEGTAIACALDGASEFADACWYERSERDGERLIVIHHPDGGFRRLALREGGGLGAADGADEPEVVVEGGLAEIAVAGSRYRLPLKEASDAAE